MTAIGTGAMVLCFLGFICTVGSVNHARIEANRTASAINARLRTEMIIKLKKEHNEYVDEEDLDHELMNLDRILAEQKERTS